MIPSIIALGVTDLPKGRNTFRNIPRPANIGLRQCIRVIRSSMMSHSGRAWPAGATTASVACRNGVAYCAWNVIAKSSRSYIVVTGRM